MFIPRLIVETLVWCCVCAGQDSSGSYFGWSLHSLKGVVSEAGANMVERLGLEDKGSFSSQTLKVSVSIIAVPQIFKHTWKLEVFSVGSPLQALSPLSATVLLAAYLGKIVL
jgi:hypothetical protein